MALVFVEDWQQGCCGELFRPGDRVSWSVRTAVDTEHLARVLGPDLAARVTHAEERHSDEDLPQLRGRVERIDAAHCAYRAVSPTRWREQEPVPGTCRLTRVAEAGRYEPARDEHDRWLGYLVELRCEH